MGKGIVVGKDNNDKLTSQYIKEQADQRYKEAKKHAQTMIDTRQPLSAMASQTQLCFGIVLDSLASMCRMIEDQQKMLEALVSASSRSLTLQGDLTHPIHDVRLALEKGRLISEIPVH